MAAQFKVVLLGEGCVGKTSLMLRYIEDKFNDKHLSTLQASFLTKRLNVNGRRVALNVWDTAGQERFHALGPIYYRDSDGAILVYDITDEDSFEKAQNWVKELRKIRGNDVMLVLAGNKTDLERDRHVTLADAERFAASVGARHCSTSAKLNKGVEELFVQLSQLMLQHKDEAAADGKANARQRNSGIVIGDADEEEQVKSKGCC